MIYSRRKFRTVWGSVALLCCLIIVMLVFGAFNRNEFTVPAVGSAASRLDGASPSAGPAAELLSRLESDARKSPVSGGNVVASVDFLNAERNVLNVARFGALTRDSVSQVLVVQVHKRIEYLAHLLESLRHVDGIRNALLIFSHDLNDEPINRLVRAVDFCRVIQIFYPYNIQLFPNVFPGQDPRDCPPKQSAAQKATCRNRNYPDKYGNYRVAAFTQIKHHWWWKMNYVFETILPKYGLDGYVMLLEEDHYLMPDSLHVLRHMIDMRPTVCKECEILCLGAHLKDYSHYAVNIAKLSVAPWFTSKHNMGMAINADTWQRIRNCSELFCTYDDYNWDWSLLAVGMRCMAERPRVIFASAPRVIHIGDCGVHAHQCESHDAAATVVQLIESHRSAFFPVKLTLAEVTKRSLKPSKPNGGWGDVRDHALCLMNSRRDYIFIAPATFQRVDNASGGTAEPPLDFQRIVSLLEN